MTPYYTHDCKACQFVGRIDLYDLYICPQAGHPTIVARFANKGPDYLSGQRLTLGGLIIELSANTLLELTSHDG